jgi:hypothetical protein
MQDDRLIEIVEEQRKKVRVENLAISLGEIVSMYKNKELILRPEYQRLLKWNKEQKTLFIESLLLGLPTPSIFVSADDLGKWEIVDGLQRVSTVIDFIEGLNPEDTKDIPTYSAFKELSDNLVYLSGEDSDASSPSFKEKKFNDFPLKLQLELKRQRINVVILSSGTSADVKYELFQRLNEGGTRITPMELRNAILVYRQKGTWDKVQTVGDSAVYSSLFSDSFIQKDDSYNRYAPILYFLTFYKKSAAIINDNEKTTNVDVAITKYVRSLDQNEAQNNLELLEKVLNKIDSLSLADKKNVFSSGKRYSDTIFGAITLGMALNIDNLPNDDSLKIKIELAVDEISKYQPPVLQRGLSASARIPNMLKFAKNYFSK